MKPNLHRFITAQAGVFERALVEVTSGRKRTHWMWFIFPQYKGLGLSETSQYYGIQNLEEAQRYLNHPILGERLKLITQALLAQPEKNVHTLFGDPDDLKLHSCMTLFAAVDTSQENVFDMALAIFFKGKMDDKTLEQISKAKGN